MQKNVVYSWKSVEVNLDALLSGRSACLKGPGLHEMCSVVEHLAGFKPPNEAVVSSLRCFQKVMQLLAKLLSSRRRARDWKQQDYSSRVCTALAAATAVLRCPGIQPSHIAAKLSNKLLADTELFGLVAAAQQEVTQLLSSYTQQLQQQPGDQQQAQQQQQAQALLLQVAYQLLLWWVEAHQLWQHNAGQINPATFATSASSAAAEGYYAHHVQAAELAAAQAALAGHSCSPEQFVVLAQVGASEPNIKVHRPTPLTSIPKSVLPVSSWGGMRGWLGRTFGGDSGVLFHFWVHAVLTIWF